ncbi:MAG TPA: LuxR C-terminal-related transcriptional regulator [Thermomicrobiales bacterium]
MSSGVEARRSGIRAINLPIPATVLFGREHEVGAVRELVLGGPRRLVTLTGPGGVGKTRLALRVAASLGDHFDDGVAFVPLAAERESEALPIAMLGALGPGVASGAPTNASALDRLTAALRERRILLVLDNLEQLVDGVVVLSGLLTACHGLRILATSRVRLRLSDEQEFPVGPLPVPTTGAGRDEVLASPAVALFAERAGAVRPGFVPSDETSGAIADICRRLDGLPLAIELAAARMAHLGPGALRRVLSESPQQSALPLLTGGVRDAPERHRTMRDAIAWSVDLLDPDTRATFARLGVFSGGFTLEAAEYLGGRGDRGTGGQHRESDGVHPAPFRPPPPSAAPVLDAIGALIDASLVQMQPAESDGETRYLMLETIREYALELLEGSGEADAVRGRLAEWLIDLNERVNEQIRGTDETAWLVRLDAEQANIRALLTWSLDRGDAETALRLATKGTWFLWSVQGTRREESRWVVRALDLVGDDVGNVDPAVLGHGLHSLGMYVHRIGEFPRARDLIERGIAHLRAAGDRRAEAIALGNLANVRTDLGDFEGTRRTLQAAIAIHRELGDPKQLIIPLTNLTTIGISTGDMAAARAAIDEADEVVRRAGNDRDVAYVRFFRGVIAVHNGNAAEAEAHLGAALAGFREVQDTYGAALVPNYLARAMLLEGRPVAAARALTGSLPLLLKMNALPYSSVTLDTLADVLIRVGRAEDGARMLGASTGFRETMNVGARPVDVAKLEGLESAARSAIGIDRFLVVESEGRQMGFEAALTEAIALAEAVAAEREEGEAGEAATPTSPRSGPFAALTAREREILGLLVQGLSDREIADRLSLSHRTVSNHVGRILAKLEVPTRTAATAVALREGLA